VCVGDALGIDVVYMNQFIFLDSMLTAFFCYFLKTRMKWDFWEIFWDGSYELFIDENLTTSFKFYKHT
jgi:hypothetical protein